MVKPIVEKTRAYYRNLGPEDICSCDYCRHYCARVKDADSEVAIYLDYLGVDIEKSFEILLPEPIGIQRLLVCCLRHFYPIKLPFEEPESEDIGP